MKVTEKQPDKLTYDLSKKITYSKDGTEHKTDKLYIKEFVYGELPDLTDKFNDFLDHFEVCRNKGIQLITQEYFEDMQKRELTDEQVSEEVKGLQKLAQEIKSDKKPLEEESLAALQTAKRGGLETSYLIKTVYPFLQKHIFCDEEMTVNLAELPWKSLGLEQRYVIDFFLVSGMLPCFISLSAKS